MANLDELTGAGGSGTRTYGSLRKTGVGGVRITAAEEKRMRAAGRAAGTARAAATREKGVRTNKASAAARTGRKLNRGEMGAGNLGPAPRAPRNPREVPRRPLPRNLRKRR